MHQLSILDAIAARDEAMARIVRSESYPDWKPIAMAYVRQFAHENRGREFSGEDIVDGFTGRGLIYPPHDRHWGPLLMQAAKDGLIFALDGRVPIRRKGHGSTGGHVYITGSKV